MTTALKQHAVNICCQKTKPTDREKKTDEENLK